MRFDYFTSVSWHENCNYTGMDTKITKLNNILNISAQSGSNAASSASKAFASKNITDQQLGAESLSGQKNRNDFENALKKKIDTEKEPEPETENTVNEEEKTEENKDADKTEDSQVYQLAEGISAVVVTDTTAADTDQMLKEGTKTAEKQPVLTQAIAAIEKASDNNSDFGLQADTTEQTSQLVDQQTDADLQNQQQNASQQHLQVETQSSKSPAQPTIQDSQPAGNMQALPEETAEPATQTIDPKIQGMDNSPTQEIQIPKEFSHAELETQEQLDLNMEQITKSDTETAENNQLNKTDLKPVNTAKPQNIAPQDSAAQTDISNQQSDLDMDLDEQLQSGSDNNAAVSKITDPAATNTAENVEFHSKIDSITHHSDHTTQTVTNQSQTESTQQQENAESIQNLSQTISKQLQQSVNVALDKNQKEISVDLSPPELGRVSIKLVENQSSITGVLQVSKSELRSEIQTALPQIIRNLEASGIQVKRIDVEVYDQTNINQQSSGNNPQQQGLASDYDPSGSSQSSYSNQRNESDTTATEQTVSTNSENYSIYNETDTDSLNIFM